MKALKTLWDIRYLPLLFVVLPQAYAVGLWLWRSSGHAELVDFAAWFALAMAIVGGAGYEAIYVGAVAWAEQNTRTVWTWITAVTALVFSVAVAVYVYRAQGTAAWLHAGFPAVAFAYTVTMHRAAAQQRIEAVSAAPDPTTLLITVLERLALPAPVLPRQEHYPLPERIEEGIQPTTDGTGGAEPLRCKHCGATAAEDGTPFTTIGQLGLHTRRDCPSRSKG